MIFLSHVPNTARDSAKCAAAAAAAVPPRDASAAAVKASTDPAMIPAAMNYAWDPGTDYPYQYAILITLVKLPLNSYEYVGNVWDPYSITWSFFFLFLYLKWVWKDFWKNIAFSFLEMMSLCFIRHMHVRPRVARRGVFMLTPTPGCPRLHLWPLGDSTLGDESLAQVRCMSAAWKASS